MAEDYSKYKPNSHKYKQEQAAKENARPKLKQIAQAKPSEPHKEDKAAMVKQRATNAGNAVLTHVIVPTVKKLIVDMVTSGIRSMVYPNEQPSAGRKYSNYDRPSYRDVDSRVVNTPQRRSVREKVILSSDEEAEAIIDVMGDLVERYGQASIADLYDLVGKTADYTDYKYGWKSVRNFGIRRNQYNESILELPRAVLLD